jgi:predicted RNA-binding protein with PIN domain
MTIWIVDAMNVLGARPDGWWRNRRESVRRLVATLAQFVAASGDRVTLVVDGRPADDLPEGEHEGVLVVYGTRRGADAADDRIVELVAASAVPGAVHVVTSDRELQRRVRGFGAQVRGAGSWLRELEMHQCWRTHRVIDRGAHGDARDEKNP